ncbi:uncharacterized protein BDZ99DRAFT_538446 [Mytilinidion resinicola]|uniref:ER transporter 6TM N-terminal domain-containing protein n=1 Tax=Mytilinidion resinicola TaxID=574789 RepID=A0A6A6YDV0_9PEZI|nr:uncharacterized protein BDZ99DRAFT_538446 [Mytilinidion resinicola]KAF2806265.1 hypothetical protein BDZ99DRAFT_538446 [Mytilinidion resinicola]
MSSSSAEGVGQPKASADVTKKQSKVKQLWSKLDLDVGTFLIMMKAALPPTIALAMYESNAVSTQYGTLGYLVAIISILGFCIMPRAKFIQTMTMNIIATCIGAAVALLMIWSSIQARKHTTPAGAPLAGYNSSQSAVCAIWLFFQIYIINSIKAKFPQFAFPTIIYSIFVNVAATYGPEFGTMTQGISFAKRLLEAFLTGFALSSGVSLFVVPTSCRLVVFKEMTGYIGVLRGALQAHKGYMLSLETTDMFSGDVTDSSEDKKGHKPKKPTERPEVAAVKKSIAALTELHGKLHGDLPFAKREVAYGKLGPDQLEEIYKKLRAIMVPTMGLGSSIDIFGRYAEMNHWDTSPESKQQDPETQARRQKAVTEWNEIMKSVHEPFSTIIQVMDDGLEHALLTLELKKAPKKKKNATEDIEAKGDTVKPGDAGFADYLDSQTERFYQGKELALREWCDLKGINLPNDFFEHPSSYKDVVSDDVAEDDGDYNRNSKQLYLLLFMEFLLYSVSRAVLSLVRYADEQVADGKMKKSKLIMPGNRRLKKWLVNIFKVEDSTAEDTTTTGDVDGNKSTIYMGEAYSARKDPEHLPPQTAWEHIGDFIRIFPRFLRSSESAFGFRAACATMSIAIVAYLHDTQVFFIKQRLVWAMIMVAISMTPSAGQSASTFFLRLIGTVLAMVLSFLMWYIPDGKTAGVIVFLFIFVTFGFYVPIKKPKFIIVGLISVVTATMIIGYELEVRKIGKIAASSNGQPYYPIYTLAPYRLATVAGGLFVAFVWTFFPYPISEHSIIRQTLGCALYLSANYYSIVHETVRARIRGDEGDLTTKGSPGKKLEKARLKVFSKQMLVLQSLKTNTAFQKWEVPLGGKFPKKEYDTIIQCVTNIVQYMSLVGYSSHTFTDMNSNHGDPSESEWFEDFRRLISSVNVTSHEITSLLALLSSAITNGQPLPPYLTTPKPYQLSARIRALDRDILSVRHIAEPGYAAFAVMQISTRCIIGDLEKLLKSVKILVGVLDFSFHIVSTNSSPASSSSSTLFKLSKQE